MIDNTLAETGADEFSIFLSGENNFRYSIYPEYKANRTAPKPRHLQAVKQHLIEKYNAQVSDGCEADDLLGIAQCGARQAMQDMIEFDSRIVTEHPPRDTIICSIDKDLRMIPGWHYSFEIGGKSSLGKAWVRPMEKVFVEEFQGLRHFYTQLLTGDSTDNIKGAAGIGKVKAERILRDTRTEQEMFEAVEACFSSREELEMTGQCLWIFRKPNDRWQIPLFANTVGNTSTTETTETGAKK
jgi:5'-3' exonuclease